MAMRTYGVETKGMAMNLTDFQDLLNGNIKGLKDKGILENLGVEFEENKDLTLIDILDFTDIIDMVYEIDYATFVGEFKGYLETEKEQERTYFNGDDIVILELKKNNLYEKYNNRDEIIAELKETLSNVGIQVDNDYIEKHFGYISGSYYA